jgi:hypothetical protein
MKNAHRYSILLLFLLLLGGITLASAACPTGCTCLTPADAKAKGYVSYCEGKQVLCGYDRLQNPMYCYTNPPVTCPTGCSCLNAADAKAKGYTAFCGGVQTLCGYDRLQNPMYCYTPPTTTTPVPACPSGCSCLNAADAKEQGYTAYCDGKQTLCGYDKSQNPLYCYAQPLTTTIPPVLPCPTGCSCLNAADAKAGGYTAFCGGKQIICGYDANQNPRYCYEPPVTPTTPAVQPCPDGCSCMDVGTAEGRGYSYCGGKQILCGTAATGAQQYCFQEEPLCPSGCECLDPSTATKMGLTTLCGGEKQVCAVIGTEWYCYGLQAEAPCTYDTVTGSCTGTCSEGQQCVLTSIQRDPATGKVTAAECTCTKIPRDSTAPTVDISQTPSNATRGEPVLLKVTADDPSGIGVIEILENGTVVKRCENSNTCTMEVEALGDTAPSPYTVRAIDRVQNQRETIYSLRYAELFRRIRPPGPDPKLKLLFVPVHWEQTQTQFNEAVDQQVQFFTDAIPLQDCPDRIRVYKLRVDTENLALFDGSTAAVQDFVEGLGYNVADFDAVIGVVNHSLVGIFPVVGRSNGDNVVWVTHSLQLPDGSIAFLSSCTAHELGHNFGMEDEYCSNPAGSVDCRCNDGDQNYCENTAGDGAATGDVNWLDAALGCNPAGSPCCNWDAGHNCGTRNYGVCCRGNTNAGGGRCVMSYADAPGPRAFCEHCQDFLATVDQLQCISGILYGRVLDVRLWIYRNGTVEEDMVVLNEGRSSIDSRKGGAYQIRVSGGAGTIEERSFDVSFDYDGPMLADIDYRNITFDKVAVNFRIPYDEAMQTLEVFREGTRIFSESLDLCRKNGICEQSENFISCPEDCPLTVSDRLCINSQDGQCDPDCAQGVDPDCRAATTTPSGGLPETTQIPLTGVGAILALLVSAIALILRKK